MSLPSVLFITLDQFRADTLSVAGHPLVHTPNLDALSAKGTRFSRHYSQAAPCAPGRAALYTGTYQMNNRVVANGTPLDDRFDNVARVARRAGYKPVLFGYTDQGIDPRIVADPGDPRLSTYEGILPGFDVGLELSSHAKPWLSWLAELGYHTTKAHKMLKTEGDRPAEHSLSSFLTDRVIEWLGRAEEPFFVHASYLRPHPPYQAPGEYATRYRPQDCPEPVPVTDAPDWLHSLLLTHPMAKAPTDRAEMAALQAQYFGMIDHIDAEVGRLLAALSERGASDDTIIIVTSDHGEQLGDQGLLEKVGYFEASYRIPLVIVDPRQRGGAGRVVEALTEAVDVLPTICDAIGVPVPLQCDGFPLTSFLNAQEPPRWRTAVHYEWDWRDVFIPLGEYPWPWDRSLESHCLSVQRSDTCAYVQYGDGQALAFDLGADPTWRTRIDDAQVLLAEAQQLLAWRAQHADRTMTGLLLRDGGIGRRPPGYVGEALVEPRVRG